MKRLSKDERKQGIINLLRSGPPRTYKELRGIAGSHMPIADLLADGTIERLPLGTYAITELENHHDTLRAFALRYPHAVICLASAASFHGLTTQNPHEVWAAFPYNQSIPRNEELHCRGFRWKGSSMEAGIERVDIGGVEVAMTSPARTVVDYLRTMNRTGEVETAMECLASYKGSLSELLKMSRALGAEKTLRPYLTAAQGLGRTR